MQIRSISLQLGGPDTLTLGVKFYAGGLPVCGFDPTELALEGGYEGLVVGLGQNCGSAEVELVEITVANSDYPHLLILEAPDSTVWVQEIAITSDLTTFTYELPITVPPAFDWPTMVMGVMAVAMIGFIAPVVMPKVGEKETAR